MGIIQVSKESSDILLLSFVGKLLEDSDADSLKSDTEVVSKSVKDLYNSQGKKIRILIDLSNFEANYVIEGTHALVDLAKKDKDFVEKSAVFCSDKKIKIFGQTVVALSRRDNIEFFDTKEQALEWLNK